MILIDDLPSLLKAIKNGAGLSLQGVTDKAGHQTKRWKKTNPDQPGGRQRGDAEEQRGAARGYGTHNLEAGHRVSFRLDGADKAGTVVSTGRTGAKVRDEEGATHDVLWSRVTGHQKPKTKAEVKAPAKSSQKQMSSASVVKPIPADRFSAADFATAHDDAEVTPEKILAEFPADTADKIKKVQGRLAGIEETNSSHKESDGEYSEDRQKLHDAILYDGITATVMDEDTGKMETKFFPGILSKEAVKAAKPKPGQKPTFTILGGRGGSGKSKLKHLVYDPDAAIVLDADHIKKLLPEYEGWNAAEVHEESGELFDRITEEAQELGLNIVHDATMKTPAKAVALVKKFKDGGYRTEAHYMHLPRQEAAKRAVNRFLGVTGRYVPIDVILSNTKNEHAFDEVKQHVDEWSFRDNNVPRNTPPILVSQSDKRSAP